MASIMPDIRNPFLKNYPATSLLKKNVDLLLINSQIKDHQQVFRQEQKCQYRNEKQNISTFSSICNPFSKKCLNVFQMLNQKRNPDDLQNSSIRSLSLKQNTFDSIEKNMFYKGLEDLGTQQMRKNEMEKQARYQLKHFGPQTLRYQYVALEKYSLAYEKQKLKSYVSVQKIPLKSNDDLNKQTPKWKTVITSYPSNISYQYYGYKDFKHNKNDDNFIIQQPNHQTLDAKRVSAIVQNTKKQKYSYFTNIPEDEKEDFQTSHNIKISKNYDQPHFINTSYRRDLESKTISIQNFNHNYNQQFSVSSGLGSPSQMYESGATFKTMFGSDKGGPLNTHILDDNKSQQQQFNLDQFDDIPKQSFGKCQILEFKNKIYYKIPL